MNFDNYKFRPHRLSDIMGGIPKPLTDKQESLFKDYTERKNGVGRALTDKQLSDWGILYARKNEKVSLNDSAKKALDKLFREVIFKRSKTLNAMQLDKGLEVEQKAVTLYSRVTGELLITNKERRENNFLNGESDIAHKGIIHDIKSSWMYDSFPMSKESIPNKGYEWQLDGYMDLWNVKQSKLVYCLVDTPFRLIEGAIRKLDWTHNIMNFDGDIRQDAIALVVEEVCQHIFTTKHLEEFCQQSGSVHIEWFKGVFVEIPEEMRVKVFNHEYCPERNQQIKEMIGLAREYMNGLLEEKADELQKLIA